MKLDFRTKIIMTLIISTLCISGGIEKVNPYLGYFVCAIPFILLLIEKKYSFFVKGMLILTIATLLKNFVVDKVSGFIGIIAVTISIVVLMMLPGVLMGYYSISTTTMSDLVESLRRMKLPDSITIPISVMFRFIYSIKEDYGLINDAMKMHGLTMKNFFKDPLKILEYKIVPLLMCSTKAADDVTVSAMTRGMVVGGKRSSISSAKLNLQDYLILLVMFGLLLLYIWSIYAKII